MIGIANALRLTLSVVLASLINLLCTTVARDALECSLYFYDTTKNHSSRWRSMSLCSNRAKAAAHNRPSCPG